MATNKKKQDEALEAKQDQSLQTFDFGEEAGVGLDDTAQGSDLLIPFINVLQSNSPQVKEPDAGGLEGARPGMLFNTVTEELIPGKEGVVFVPGIKLHKYVEWVPRDNGGGFAGMYNLDDPAIEVFKKHAAENNYAFGKLKNPENQNDVVETYYIYGVQVDLETMSAMGMIGLHFTSTKIKPYRGWNQKQLSYTTPPEIGKQKPPVYCHLVRMVTEFSKNNKGEFYNVKLAPALGVESLPADHPAHKWRNGKPSVTDASLLPPSHPLAQAGKEVRQLVEQGVATGAFEQQNATVSDEVEEGTPF